MKKSFIAGLILLLPIIITFFIIFFLLDVLTAPFLEVTTHLLERFQNTFPALGSPEILKFVSRITIIFLFIVSIFILGFLGRWFLFKTFLALINAIFMRIPLFKSVYHTAKDMISSLISIKKRKAFKYPLLAQFPSSKSKCIGFASGEIPKSCKKYLKDYEPVFIPTAPHPISGYLIFTKKENIKNITMTNEDAVKFTVSCGVIVPPKYQNNEG